jgi:2'-hydroxyisoflavone reductase
VWAPEPWLAEHGIDDEAFPMWEPGASGLVTMDASRGRSRGLVHRGLERTVRETLEWDRERGLPPLTTGLKAEDETALLAELDAAG